LEQFEQLRSALLDFLNNSNSDEKKMATLVKDSKIEIVADVVSFGPWRFYPEKMLLRGEQLFGPDIVFYSIKLAYDKEQWILTSRQTRYSYGRLPMAKNPLASPATPKTK